jgi:hypothetical protein
VAAHQQTGRQRVVDQLLLLLPLLLLEQGVHLQEVHLLLPTGAVLLQLVELQLLLLLLW